MSEYPPVSPRMIPSARGFCKTRLTHKATLTLIHTVRDFGSLWNQKEKFYGNRDWALSCWNNVIFTMFYSGCADADLSVNTWYELVRSYFNHNKTIVELSDNDKTYMERMNEFMYEQDENEQIVQMSIDDILCLPMVRKYFYPIELYNYEQAIVPCSPVKSKEVPAPTSQPMVEVAVQASPRNPKAKESFKSDIEKKNISKSAKQNVSREVNFGEKETISSELTGRISVSSEVVDRTNNIATENDAEVATDNHKAPTIPVKSIIKTQITSKECEILRNPQNTAGFYKKDSQKKRRVSFSPSTKMNSDEIEDLPVANVDKANPEQPTIADVTSVIATTSASNENFVPTLMLFFLVGLMINILLIFA